MRGLERKKDRTHRSPGGGHRPERTGMAEPTEVGFSKGIISNT